MESTIVWLKLPVFHRKHSQAVDLISGSLANRGLKFLVYSVSITEADILAIYGHIPLYCLISQIAMFAQKTTCMWHVHGHDAVRIVDSFKGSEINPAMCSHDTWRFRLGELIGVRQFTLVDKEGKPLGAIFENYVHCPKPGEEQMNLAAFGHHFA
jgi:hypothetical protein